MLQAFQNAPPEIQARLQELLDRHVGYKDLLVQMHSPATAAGTTVLTDGRDEPPAEAPEEPVHLKTWPSEEKLKAEVSIVKECKAQDLRIFLDDKGGYYLLSPSEEHTVRPGTHLGSVGSGSLLAADSERQVVIPWALPAGDKTQVQLLLSFVEDDEAPSAKEKFAFGSLYSVVRDLEWTATTDITLTSFGRILPQGNAGRHTYDFEFPPGHARHESIEFVPNPVKEANKPVAANFFAGTIGRSKAHGIAAHGALTTVWRLSYNTVGHLLKPQKPSIVAKDEILLPAGQPVLVAWQ